MTDTRKPKKSEAISGNPSHGETPGTPAGQEGTAKSPSKPKEVGGPKGLEPTRYGDWERKGIVSDF